MSDKIEIDDTVEWSEPRTKIKEPKRGVIAAIFRPGWSINAKDLSSILGDDYARKYSTKAIPWCAQARMEDTAIIVGEAMISGKPRLYWRRLSQLRKVNPDA